MNLIKRFKAWQRKHKADARHLEFLKVMIREDYRWLAHDPLARNICDRYIRAASENWNNLSHENTVTFRHRIGLEPDYNNKNQ